MHGTVTLRSVLPATGLALVTAACGGGTSCDPRTCAGATSRVEDLPPLTASAVPAWDEPATGAASPAAEPEHVEIHLDVSSPMGGYLPPDEDGDLSAFQLVAQNAAQHMVRVFGGADAPVRWVGVGHELQDLGARPPVERDLFDGRSTELDLSMARMLGDFRSGRAEAAVLVSDLMATGDVTGPLTLFDALGAWLQSADVRGGAFHVGLFGLKADYWGVRVRGCAARAPLGCRFDELRRRWIALEKVEQIPVYVLVLGRGASRVEAVMESLQATVDELNRGRGAPLETQWELLTRATLGQDATVACRAGAGGGDQPEPQYALFVDEQGQHCCVRDEAVTLFCDVEGGFQPAAARATWVLTPAAAPVAEAEMEEMETESETVEEDDAAVAVAPPAPPPAVDARIDGTRLVFDFSCAAVRCGQPARGLELLLEATGAVENAAVDWRDGWSTETGELGKTLQLQGFVEAVRVRPDRYRLETPALLRFPGR